MEEKINKNTQKDNAIIHKDNSLNRLDVSFIKHIDAEEYKTSHLLSYWINDFANYHDEEKTFNTTKLITFKRGRIIKANLGFNIGNELGGLHYCIVINKFDNPKNGTLTVVPLTSKKNKKYPHSSVDLGNEIYTILNSLYSKEIEKLSLKTKILKQAKKIPLINRFSEIAKRHIGSTDYRSASAIMREILVSTVNLDITYDVKKITCPTLIVWGDLDAAVPLEDAYTLEGLIKDAAVIVYEGCTHYAYLENLGQTISIIGSFVRS